MSSQKNSDISKVKLTFTKDCVLPQKLSGERIRVMRDLAKCASFKPFSDNNAPYSIELSTETNKLIFKIKNADEKQLPLLILSMSPYKRIIKDYFMMIDSYEQLRAHSTQSKLETIDMARRGVHNEAAEIIMERLADKITMDMDTARGLFTLICVLHLGNVNSGWV